MTADAPPSLIFDRDGLITGVVQHADTGEILMVGYLNEESWARTQETGHLWFWSRSRQELWEKGSTSGNYLAFTGARLDCDGDALLLLARPSGPTCHTGSRSCFRWEFDRSRPATRSMQTERAAVEQQPQPLDALYATILERKRTMPAGSYVAYLLTEGIDKIDKKLGEEVAEVIVASKNDSPERLANEMADLWFHCVVLLAAYGLSPRDVWSQLEQRKK